MAESISAQGQVTDTPSLGVLTTQVSNWGLWREIFQTDGTQIQLGDTYGALTYSGTSGIILLRTGIDPIIQYILTTRLATTGQIWPISTN